MSALLLLCCLLLTGPVASFVVQPTAFAVSSSVARSAIYASPAALDWSSELVSADVIDPTSFLNDLLGGILNTPIILAVPIVAALTVAFLIGFFIVSYASPEVDDDE